jgi:hypothetical protein
MNDKMSRRKFFAAVSVGGVAAAAAVVATKDGDVQKADSTQASPQGKGYQLSAHVRRYYETTKV